MAPLPLTVEFLADGRCTVSGSAGGPRGDVARTPQPSDGSGAEVARGLQASGPAGAGFRCTLPSAALSAGPVELRVLLPSGSGRASESFPTLEWRQAGHDWVGTATLPSAPAFVSIGRPAPANAASHFGWNFYGFFLFAALFIAFYLAWARWMARSARTAAPAGPDGAVQHDR